MNFNRAMKWVVLTSAVIGTGCAANKAPSFVVKDASLVERTERATVISFAIEGTNPSDAELPLVEAEYRVTRNDGGVAHGARRSPEVVLPRRGSQVFRVPVVFEHGEGGPLMEVGYTLSGTVVYQVPGAIAELLFDSRVRRPSVSFAETGRLDLSALGAAPIEPAPGEGGAGVGGVAP